MANNAAYYDNIRHTLDSIHSAPLVITDPIGYETSDEEFTRTIKNVGIISNFSADLKFVDDGLDFIEDVINNHGLNEVVTLTKEGQDPITDEWIVMYTSTLDLTTCKIENNELSVKINSGGFDKIFKARESEKLEIEATKSIDGVTLPALTTKSLTLGGRDIFFRSIFDVSETDNTAILFNDTKGNQRGCSVCVPLNIVSKSDTLVHSPIPNTRVGDDSEAGIGVGSAGLIFYGVADEPKTLDVNLSLTFDVNEYPPHSGSANTWTRSRLRIVIYKDGEAYNYATSTDLWYTDDIKSFDGTTQTKTFNGTIVLGKGQSASLQFNQVLKGNSATANSYMEYIYGNITANMVIEEESNYSSTTTEAIQMFDLGERVTQLITGQSGAFKSSVLGTGGDWEFLTTYCGHWLRGFGLSDDKYKKFTTSFKDLSQSLQALLNVHVGFQMINGVEEVIAEPMEYFFNPNVVLVLPTPLANVSRYVAEDIIFSSVSGGYEKGGVVEGIMGLDEPNGQANWISNITALKSEYSILSKYIAGVYSEEKQRRLNKFENPTLDTDMDKEIFVKDCKDVSGTLTERLWGDDFAVAPTGIFSPSTAKNLRLSPSRNLRRHSNLLATPLKHYQSQSLAFGSSTANSAMTTQLIGGSSITENADILNSAFGTPLFEPFYIEGEHAVTTDIINTLKDFTNFSGVDVSNFYCKVQFTIEGDATVRYGYIMSLKPSGVGKWKFIEAATI